MEFFSTGGRIKDEKKQRRLSWPVLTVATGVLLGGTGGRISEGVLSSDSCEEATVTAPTTRCERSSTAQVLAEVAATPGAIGYADAPAAKAASARAPR